MSRKINLHQRVQRLEDIVRNMIVAVDELAQATDRAFAMVNHDLAKAEAKLSEEIHDASV
jgi:hypothetical protein